MELIRGNPIIIIIISIIYSLISLVIILSTRDWIFLFVIFSIFYNLIFMIVFYIAYKRSTFAFMSPKKYKKAEMICKKNQKLYDLLISIDSNNDTLKPENAIDKAIEILKM